MDRGNLGARRLGYCTLPLVKIFRKKFSGYIFAGSGARTDMLGCRLSLAYLQMLLSCLAGEA